jgi:hypothetical protein
VARYDKYDNEAGGFRVPLAAAITDPTKIGVPLAIGLDASGLAVIGAGSAVGVVGVYVADQAKAVGDIADVMTNGEIVDLDEAAFDPGKTFYAAANGTISATAAATSARVGFTVGDRSLTTGVITSRLIVRAAPPDSIGAS